MERYTGPKGKIIGMRSFGASAPLKDLLKKFGMEADKGRGGSEGSPRKVSRQ